MINASVNNAKLALHVDGDVAEVAADIGMIVGLIYAQTRAANPNAAAQFRYAITASLVDMDSPVWSMTADDRTPMNVEEVKDV